MASLETSYTEIEANEILRTAVRLSAAEKLSIDDLAKAAAEIGIGREDVERAESDFNRLRTEEGARKEFRRLQINQFKIWILYGLCYLLIECALDFGRRGIWNALGYFSCFVALGWIYAGFCLLFPNAPPYKKKYTSWRLLGSGYLTPEEAHKIVQEVVIEAIDNHLSRDNAELILMMKIGYDSIRAKEVLESFLYEHPQFSGGLS